MKPSTPDKTWPPKPRLLSPNMEIPSWIPEEVHPRLKIILSVQIATIFPPHFERMQRLYLDRNMQHVWIKLLKRFNDPNKVMDFIEDASGLLSYVEHFDNRRYSDRLEGFEKIETMAKKLNKALTDYPMTNAALFGAYRGFEYFVVSLRLLESAAGKFKLGNFPEKITGFHTTPEIHEALKITNSGKEDAPIMEYMKSLSFQALKHFGKPAYDVVAELTGYVFLLKNPVSESKIRREITKTKKLLKKQSVENKPKKSP